MSGRGDDDGTGAAAAASLSHCSSDPSTSTDQQEAVAQPSSTAPPTVSIERLQYDPAVLARYVHYRKTGQDLNNPLAEAPPRKKAKKRKHIPPAVLQTRLAIQLCCRDNNLPLALQIFHNAMKELVVMDAKVFYNLVNLCEGTFGERTAVHVGTPKNNGATHEQRKGGEKPGGMAAEVEKMLQAHGEATTNATTISLQERLRHAREIHALMSKLDMPLTEQAYTAIIRLACRAGEWEQAEGYLDEAERTPQCKPKLRMYSSLLRAYCGALEGEDAGEDCGKSSNDNSGMTQERLVKALRVWRRMHDRSGGPSTGHPNYASNKRKLEEREEDAAPLFGEGISPKIQPTECEYAALVSCATTLRDVPVMERVLSDVADRVLVPGKTTTDAIVNWFRSDNVEHTSLENTSSALDHVTLPPRVDPPLGCASNASGKGWKVYRGCTVDPANGELTLTSPEGNDESGAPGDARYRLKPVELTERAWDAMREMNAKIVLEGQVEGHVSQYQGGGKGKKRARGGTAINSGHQSNRPNNPNGSKGKSNRRIDAWDKFQSFLAEHPPYDVVIDGANVGYFQTNFASSPKHVDYAQIDGLVRHLLDPPDDNDGAPRHRIILFLHERHFSPNLAPGWAIPIIQRWDGAEAPYDRLTVYRTPVGMNDDWYWMHSALAHGGKAGSPSVVAITNDEMRDHHFQMLAEGSFLRWKERHQVYFDFGPWNARLGRREARLRYPPKYSRRIQRIECEGGVGGGEAFVIPLPKKGDEGRFADGVHVAEEGVPEEETYVVIQRVT
ncbi:hypothetical protein ACHAXT_001834 [Thalassiosira profunda]